MENDKRVYVYGDSFASYSVAVNLCTKVLPEINRDLVIGVCDRDGARDKWEQLLSSVNAGDYVILASVFALEDADSEMSAIHRLHKLQRKGVRIHTVLEPTVSIQEYDNMLKVWHLLQKQKEEYMFFCGGSRCANGS